MRSLCSHTGAGVVDDTVVDIGCKAKEYHLSGISASLINHCVPWIRWRSIIDNPSPNIMLCVPLRGRLLYSPNFVSLSGATAIKKLVTTRILPYHPT